MKLLTMSALVAAQIMVAAQPAMAADLGEERAGVQRQGAFAGARLRVPLGGGDRTARAGLTVAPVLHGQRDDGSARTRFGEGMEFGFAGTNKPGLAFAGTPIARIGESRTGPDGRRMGVSTWKGLAIAGGVVVLTLAGVALLLVSNE